MFLQTLNFAPFASATTIAFPVRIFDLQGKEKSDYQHPKQSQTWPFNRYNHNLCILKNPISIIFTLTNGMEKYSNKQISPTVSIRQNTSPIAMAKVFPLVIPTPWRKEIGACSMYPVVRKWLARSRFLLLARFESKAAISSMCTFSWHHLAMPAVFLACLIAGVAEVPSEYEHSWINGRSGVRRYRWMLYI